VSYTPCNMAILHSFSFSHVNPLTSLPDGLRGGFLEANTGALRACEKAPLRIAFAYFV